MRVAIDWEDGSSFMYDPLEYYVAPPDEVWLAANTIEVPDDVWEAYRKFQAESRKWDDYCRDLGNAIYERQHAEVKP